MLSIMFDNFRFIKLLNRGEHNSCTRCDLVFKPLPDSKLARKREEREKRGIPATTPIKEEREKVYHKVPKFSDARNFAVIHLKFKQRCQT